MKGTTAEDMKVRRGGEPEGEWDLVDNLAWNFACDGIVKCDCVVAHLTMSASSINFSEFMVTHIRRGRQVFAVALPGWRSR